MTDLLILTYTLLILAPSIHSSLDDNEIEEPMAYPPGVPRSIYELYNNRIQQDLEARRRNQEQEEHHAVEEETAHYEPEEEAYPPGVPHTIYKEEEEVPHHVEDPVDTIHQTHHAFDSDVPHTFHEEHHGSEITEDNEGHHEENHNGNWDNTHHVEEHDENGDNTHIQEEDDDEGVIIDAGLHEVHHEQEEAYAPGVPHQTYEYPHVVSRHVELHEEAASPTDNHHENVETKPEEHHDNDENHAQHNHTHSILEAGHVMDDSELKHLEKHLLVDTSKMTDIELAFHYFKAHDTDQNQMLDGLELIKFMILSEVPVENATPKIFTDNELMDTIENMLKDGDLDHDGFISYSEFRKSYGIE